MKSIVEINEEVFQTLEEIRKEKELTGENFTYTLRRTNQYNKLDLGYWFYGGENYLSVSFWRGFDSKNKTPNIYFNIWKDGSTSLVFSLTDSILKNNLAHKYFIQPVGLTEQETDIWTKKYSTDNYLQSLHEFIKKDKKLIDEIINKNLNNLISEDTNNSFDFIKQNDFFKWLGNVNSFRRKEKSRDKAYGLSSISIRKFLPVMSLSIRNIPSNAPFIILVGENGSGKSSILQALATAIGNHFIDEEFEPRAEFWEIQSSLFIAGEKSKFKISRFNEKTGLRIPFAAYGPSRLLTDNRELRNVLNEFNKDRTAPLWSIFNPDGILRDINRWVIKMTNNLKSSLDESEIKLRFENIKNMLISVIPNIYDIRREDHGMGEELYYFEEDFNGNKIPKGVIFEHLSSGLKSMIAMIGDMMLRLFEQQPELTDPAELAGIVLIDEIDIHLHPNWQKKLPTILSENFPKIQFIVTTHSPIPLLGAPSKSIVFTLSRSAEYGISAKLIDSLNISNLLPNTILTSPIFGMDSLVSVNNEDSTQINVDNSYDDTLLFELLDKKMDELVKNESLLNKKYFEK